LYRQPRKSDTSLKGVMQQGSAGRSAHSVTIDGERNRWGEDTHPDVSSECNNDQRSVYPDHDTVDCWHTAVIGQMPSDVWLASCITLWLLCHSYRSCALCCYERLYGSVLHT
jgi:hypothetical protein